MIKYMIATFPNGDRYKIPTKIIADDYVKYYLSKGEQTEKELKEEVDNNFQDTFEIEDWAFNNMNWEDVENHAVKIEKVKIDLEEEWGNVGEIEFSNK